MKKKNIAIATTFAFLTLSMVSVFSFKDEKKVNVDAYSTTSLPSTIDLNDASDSTIRNYYSTLNNLSTSERSGTNLLKNLKNILKNGQKYLSYDSGSSVWDAYCIVDRDWEKSPATALPAAAGTYNPSTNKITNYKWGGNSAKYENPYLHILYFNRDKETVAQAYGDHGNATHNPTGINREHIWPKGAGFDSSGSGGARGDLMHLWAAHGHTNNKHSNYYYGYVDKTKTYKDEASDTEECAGNLLGFSKTLGGSTNVFEPQDCDKGDIARAVFYMAARYNYYSGSDSDGIDTNNPNLELVNNLSSFSSGGYTSSTSTTGKLGIVQDLLEWNRLDPPDEWEIHRNNLCYNNFTNNRNPFIDFPEWAEYVWGKSTSGSYNSNPTGYATPSSNAINDFSDGTIDSVTISKTSVTLSIGNTTTINAVSSDSSTITWTTSNSSVASISASSSNSGANITITANASGSATITAKATIGGVQHTDKCTVTVHDQIINVTSVSLSETSKTLVNGGHFALTATVLPNNATNKNITWTSSNTNIATVENGTVTAKAVGNATITVTTEDGGKTATCTVTVISSGGGEQTTSSMSIASYASSHSWTNDTKYTSVNIDANVTASVAVGDSNTGKYYSNGSNWRFYQKESAQLTISVPSGYTIDSVTLTFTVENTGSLKYGNTTVTSGSSININSTSATFSVSNSGSATNGQVRFTNLSVTYHSDSSPADPTSITASVDKTFYVGDTITKSDISVIDDLGRDINDFEFTSYTFTYEDAVSGGDLTNKQFTATYDELSDTFTAQVARRAYHTPETASMEFTGSEFATAGVSTDNKNKTTGNVTVDGINFYVYKAYVYNYGTTLSFSDSKTAASGYMYNVTAFGTGIASITVNDNNVTPVLRVKANEADEWIEVDEDFDFYNDNYHYFKLDYDYSDGTTISAYTNISSIEVELKGNETALTTSDYLMYEDTNNQCVSKLSTATLIFENMTLSERNTFMTSNDYVISKARERLNAWAVNQGKVINHVNGDYILESASSSHTKLVELSKDTSTGIVIILISIVTIGSLSVFYLYRKRKE